MNILHKISYDGHESVVRKPHSNCIMKSVSGEKISISDGSDHPITRLVLSIDMNEDYNGYDKAWAGGEGKNLLPQFIQDGTYNGVTFTTNKNGSISSEGTATGAVYVASVRIPLEAGTYYFTGTPAGGSAATYNSHADLYDGTTLLRSLGLDTGDGLSFTISAEEAGKEAEFVLHIAEGVTAPEDTWKFFLCTENIPFEPYENISTLIPYDQVVLKVNGHYYVQDLPEEFCAGFVDLIAGRIVSSYHTDHTEKAEQTNIQPREICTQPGENKMSMNVPGTIEVIYCVDLKMLTDKSGSIEKMIAPVLDNNVADRDYKKNSYVIINDVLYIFSKNVAAGEQIVPGTNCVEISLGEILNKNLDVGYNQFNHHDFKTIDTSNGPGNSTIFLYSKLDTVKRFYGFGVAQIVSKDGIKAGVQVTGEGVGRVIAEGKYNGSRYYEIWMILGCNTQNYSVMEE